MSGDKHFDMLKKKITALEVAIQKRLLNNEISSPADVIRQAVLGASYGKPEDKL